jgi:hypothetical protein
MATRSFNTHNRLHPIAASVSTTDNDDEMAPPPSDDDDELPAAHINKRPRLLIGDVATRPPVLSSSHFPNESTMRFWQDQLKNDDGIQQLVYRAISKVHNLRSNEVESEEALFHLKFVFYLLGQSKLQREELTYLIEKGFMNNTNAWRTRLPVTISDFNSFYLRSSSSIVKTLPYPRPKIVDNHATISLIELTAYALAFQKDIKLIKIPRSENEKVQPEEVSTVDDSYAFRLLLEKAELKLSEDDDTESAAFGGMDEWGDDFDPGHVKRNKGSIWIFVVSFGCPDSERNSTRHVYPVALGRKGDSHDSVMKQYNDELAQIQNGMEFYHGGLKRNIKVYADVDVIAVDRPEKTALTKTSSHVGNSTKRALHVAPLSGPKSKDFFENLVSCPECFERNVKGLPEPEGGCCKCTNWDFYPSDARNKDLLLEKPGPTYPIGYKGDTLPSDVRPVPKDEEEARLFMIGPVELTIELLKACVMFCFLNVWSRTWNVDRGHEYLRLCGLPEELYKSYCTLAYRQRREHDYSKVTLPEFPPSWQRDVALFRYIDSPMHMLFLGIVESTIELLSSALSKMQKHSAFARRANSTLDRLRKLSLDFLRAGLFSGKKFTTGPWVSEQFLAFSRVCKELYGDLDSLPHPSRRALPVEFYARWYKIDFFTVCLPHLRNPIEPSNHHATTRPIHHGVIGRSLGLICCSSCVPFKQTGYYYHTHTSMKWDTALLTP